MNFGDHVSSLKQPIGDTTLITGTGGSIVSGILVDCMKSWQNVKYIYP